NRAAGDAGQRQPGEGGAGGAGRGAVRERAGAVRRAVRGARGAALADGAGGVRGGGLARPGGRDGVGAVGADDRTAGRAAGVGDVGGSRGGAEARRCWFAQGSRGTQRGLAAGGGFHPAAGPCLRRRLIEGGFAAGAIPLRPPRSLREPVFLRVSASPRETTGGCTPRARG